MPEYMNNYSGVNDCCKMACDTLSVIGVNYATNPQTIANWNMEFRNTEQFHHPNPSIASGKKSEPPLFELFPEVIDLIKSYCSKNMDHLTVELVHNHITTVIFIG